VATLKLCRPPVEWPLVAPSAPLVIVRDGRVVWVGRVVR
jgi:hypothetical protein